MSLIAVANLPANASRPDLAGRLRAETAVAHQALEDSLGFDLHQADGAIARHMLRAFGGMVPGLEERLAQHLPGSFLEGRHKADLLRADLRALGDNPDTLPQAPLGNLAATPAAALGTLYVLEGSTLGGKLINRALKRLPDWPLGDPSYFDPYGRETGAMWQRLVAALNAWPARDADGVVNGANQCFERLKAWMSS